VLHVDGRADAVIVSGGENVDPLRVEAALETLDGVSQAYVFGTADDEWGASVTAWIVARPGVNVGTLRSELREVLAPHEIPRTIRVVDSLPQTPSGKLDRSGRG
jgi:fatty-acyl-CoA synthase